MLVSQTRTTCLVSQGNILNDFLALPYNVLTLLWLFINPQPFNFPYMPVSWNVIHICVVMLINVLPDLGSIVHNSLIIPIKSFIVFEEN